ncbi:MAG: AbrB/MazE/SpoVT family DNA-binding domain-containing protein [Caulobacteraceae bacterium]
MQELVRPFTTVSDRIRALAAAGVARADIARFLGKRYQHVRNVLVEDERRSPMAGVSLQAGPGPGEEPAPVWSRPDPGSATDVGNPVRLMLDDNGSIWLPPEVQAALSYERGGVVIARLHHDRLELLSTGAAMRRARDMIRRHIPPGGESMVDSLIADRRREAAREEED